MEHKLILGGEQHLPFARSCVAKLKQLGLSHVSQSYMVDGCLIRVRIEPGHEYIRIEGGGSAYLETGQLEPSPIGEEHPDRGSPAKWHFLNIAPDSPYLGLCDVAGKPKGEQVNRPALFESMDSLAIGYKRDPDPEKDAEIKASKTDSIIAKTVISGLFMPSRWSGLMRLFMQALYGADLAAFPLQLAKVGTQTILNYQLPTGEVLQFGLWDHASPGIFSAESDGKPLGKFWLINIRNPTGTLFIATAYQLKLSSSGKYVRKQYLVQAKKGTLTPEDRVKLEAYMFANSTLDLANPKIIGTFAGAPGSSLAYGWKFNKTGSKASVVLHETLGTGVGDLRWRSATVHVEFAHTFNTETKLDELTLSAETVVGGEWTDGWGEYNIFVPMFDVDASGFGLDALVHASLAVNRLGVKPAFAFTGVPVYGYYKDDVWTPTLMTRTIEPGPWPKYEQSCNMPFRDPGVADTVKDRYQYDARLAGSGYTYESMDRTKSSTMDVAVGGTNFIGVSQYGARKKIIQTVINKGGFEGPASTVNYLSKQFSGLYFTVADYYGNPPGWGQPDPGDVAADYMAARCTYVTNTWIWTGWKFDSWTLVIPAYDCEAVFVGVHKYDSADGAVAHTIDTEPHRTYLTACRPVSVQPYCNYQGGWYGDTNAATQTTDPELPPQLSAQIYCFTPFVAGTQGTFHASSTPLFQVDKNYPYYAAGMGVHTSHGGRYAITEGLISPASVVYGRPFVGWA